MPKQTVYAKFTAQPGKGDEVITALKSMMDQVATEAGTELYAVSRAADNPDTLFFFEVYTDAAALGAHSGSEAMKAFGGKLAGLLAARPEIVRGELHDAKGVAL